MTESERAKAVAYCEVISDLTNRLWEALTGIPTEEGTDGRNERPAPRTPTSDAPFEMTHQQVMEATYAGWPGGVPGDNAVAVGPARAEESEDEESTVPFSGHRLRVPSGSILRE